MLHNEITSEKKREMFKVNYVLAVSQYFVYAWVRDKLKSQVGVRVEVHEKKSAFIVR